LIETDTDLRFSKNVRNYFNFIKRTAVKKHEVEMKGLIIDIMFQKWIVGLLNSIKMNLRRKLEFWNCGSFIH